MIITLKDFLNESQEVLRHLKLIYVLDGNSKRVEVDLKISKDRTSPFVFEASYTEVFDRGSDSYGANPKKILALFPDLGPFIRLNKCIYPTGEPLFYQPTGIFAIESKVRSMIKEYWRIENEDDLSEAMYIYLNNKDGVITDSQANALIYKLMGKQWRIQAEDAVSCLDEHQAKYGGKVVGNVEGVVIV